MVDGESAASFVDTCWSSPCRPPASYEVWSYPGDELGHLGRCGHG